MNDETKNEIKAIITRLEGDMTRIQKAIAIDAMVATAAAVMRRNRLADAESFLQSARHSLTRSIQ